METSVGKFCQNQPNNKATAVPEQVAPRPDGFIIIHKYFPMNVTAYQEMI
jgi:hypothetical protein